MKATKFTLTATVVAAVLGLALGMSAVTAEAANCVARPEHKDCNPPPPGEEVTLTIEYEFGPGAGSEITTITATGLVECGKSGTVCVFTATDSQGIDFSLPAALRELLILTSWHKVELDPDACFDFYGVPPVGAAEITAVTLRLAQSDQEGDYWGATVSATAWDISGANERSYQFRFMGGCEFGAGCDVESNFTAHNILADGYMDAIWSSGPDKKLGGTPCRCTMSNDPDCPDDVPVLPIPIHVEVTVP